MAWRLIPALVLATAFNSGIAAAQASSDDPFCALASIEMLAALEGGWTLTQDKGFAVAADMAIPLPAHPPQSFTIEFDETLGLAYLSGGSPRQTLAMVPTALVDIAEMIWFMTEAEAEGVLEIGAGCDYYSLPVMLGFNTYSLTQPTDDYVLAVAFGGVYTTLCLSKSEADAIADNSAGVAGLIGDTGTEIVIIESDLFDADDPGWSVCNSDIPAPTPGTMVMSLALKFQSPTSAIGMLHFEGEKNGHSFFARAPVTMSR